MSLQDELSNVQRALDELLRAVGRLEPQAGTGLDMRRVRTDADHLRESFALLRTAMARPGQPTQTPELVTIPDAPYDSSLWTDAEDEGLGSRDRHAP
ncbi:hypothetical protein [Streptomyces meridianus]|uniref:Uncharacterized protein n=1 Tax=Streptomyces meridianus TaxID=2938945 RepID=A0ABT0X338_9ACTN|nr:hypothetical protein [Streptomyces meridianus]MCM2576229.1 hypothetical protein [Streptomyces meridianus]